MINQPNLKITSDMYFPADAALNFDKASRNCRPKLIMIELSDPFLCIVSLINLHISIFFHFKASHGIANVT
jgi:hypothetical protein